MAQVTAFKICSWKSFRITRDKFGEHMDHFVEMVNPNVLKKQDGGVMTLQFGQAKPAEIKAYFKNKIFLLEGKSITDEVSFGTACVANMMKDIDFINQIPLDKWNFSQPENADPLSAVTEDALGQFTTFLVLRLLLEFVMNRIGGRIKETWPDQIVGDRDATLQTIRTPDTRTVHPEWVKRLDTFIKQPLARYFWEKGTNETRTHIITMLQINNGSRVAVSKLKYLTKRQDGYPERQGWAMGCQQDGKKNCDRKQKSCNQCQGLETWLQSHLPKENGAITDAMVRQKAQELWNADPKCSKFKNTGEADCHIIGSIWDEDFKVVRDNGAYLNGSEIDDGVAAQWAEKMSKARQILTRQQNQKRKGSK